jgi:hypothetical protein
MKKRRNDTHKLEANDEKDAREPKLLPDEELTPVTGGSTTDGVVDETKPRIVSGEIWDEQITIYLPGVGLQTLTLC